MNQPTFLRKIFNPRLWGYGLFWSWNLIFLAFVLLGFAPRLLPAVRLTSSGFRETRKLRRLKTPDGPIERELVFRDLVVGAEVDGQTTEIVLSDEDRLIFGRCTCTFFAEHLLNQGPCAHLVATRLAADALRAAARRAGARADRLSWPGGARRQSGDAAGGGGSDGGAAAGRWRLKRDGPASGLSGADGAAAGCVC